ncbi:protein of unknown function [Raineyella antarctica]|uniref:DUF4352 domain-containing protein n=1 Tax=Raineyella antarctica TaxID=1577474 RepID=A0A1G6GZQ8_9ACTN|nr:DUF4352 domain-containing protein [Raineyella antarctica]SDB86596.1 protein of unknown function [Raineyella antarctica]
MSQPPYPQQPGTQYQQPDPRFQQFAGQPYPPQQPVKPKKKWFKRPLVWILAIIAVIAIAVNAGGGDDQAASTAGTSASSTAPSAGSPSSQAAAPAEKAAAPAAGLNTAVAAGDLQYTVTKVSKGVAKVGDQYVSQEAQGQFVLVNVTVKNTGKSAVTFMSTYTKLYDKDGVEYSSDSTAEIYANTQSQTFLEQVNPGNSVKGVLVFDIPKDVTPVRLGVTGGMLGAEKDIALS